MDLVLVDLVLVDSVLESICRLSRNNPPGTSSHAPFPRGVDKAHRSWLDDRHSLPSPPHNINSWAESRGNPGGSLKYDVEVME